jgi:hypothetical protein
LLRILHHEILIDLSKSCIPPISPILIATTIPVTTVQKVGKGMGLLGVMSFLATEVASDTAYWIDSANFSDSISFTASANPSGSSGSNLITVIIIVVCLVALIIGGVIGYVFRAKLRFHKRELLDIEQVMLPSPGESYDIAHV